MEYKTPSQIILSGIFWLESKHSYISENWNSVYKNYLHNWNFQMMEVWDLF